MQWRPDTMVLALLTALSIAACDEGGGQQSSSSGLNIECLADLPEPDSSLTAQASVSLAIEKFSYSFTEDRHRYNHNRRFKESGGVGLYIYRGRICVADGTDCADACVRYRVDAGGSLLQPDHHVATDKDPDRITLEYWARDDAGNKLTFSKVLVTKGETARVEK